uniref:6,7-dimethyl-8-ribityllumazine synthase n=1 Tax=Panagrolaimus superbus TaxID=310955 RepID=A0A914Y3C3_9BILA
MAETGEFDALIALGAVIRGDTYHFEVVSNESASAITQDEQAEIRAAEKGRDCARTAVELGNLIAVLEPELDDDEDEDYEDEDLDDDK